MSAKFFCDECGAELLPDEHGTIKRRLGKISININRAVNECWGGGHVCWGCTMRVVGNGKPL